MPGPTRLWSTFTLKCSRQRRDRSQMRNYFVRDIRAAHAGFRHISGFQLEHAIALEHIEGVAERANHRVIAHAVHVVKARNNRKSCAQRSPIAAAKIAVAAEGEDLAAGIGRTEAQAF